jgi:hypothetical protein
MKERIQALILKLLNRVEESEEIRFAKECVDTSERTQSQKMPKIQTRELTSLYALGSVAHVQTGNETKMLDGLSMYQIIILASGLIGIYIKLKLDLNNVKVNFKSELEKIEMRQKIHESQTEDIKKDISKLLEAVEEIKLLLARKQLDN